MAVLILKGPFRSGADDWIALSEGTTRLLKIERNRDSGAVRIETSAEPGTRPRLIVTDLYGTIAAQVGRFIATGTIEEG